MFITLDDNFYPLELTFKEHILNYKSLLDRNICSWKTRRRLRMRTERKITAKQSTRKFYRVQIWQAKQNRLLYQIKGYFNYYCILLYSSLFFLFLVELFYALRSSTLFYHKSCYIRRKNRKQQIFLLH